MTLMAQTLTRFANIHIVSAVMAMTNRASLLPGGIHRTMAPEGTPYPFAVMTYAGGSDKLSIGDHIVGGGLLFQVKVVDRTADESAATAAYLGIQEALYAANNSSVSGAYVAGQEETPLDLPITEKDQQFQQIGSLWRFWIDPV